MKIKIKRPDRLSKALASYCESEVEKELNRGKRLLGAYRLILAMERLKAMGRKEGEG